MIASRLNNKYIGYSVKFRPRPSSEELVVLIISSVLGYKGFSRSCKLPPSSLSLSWKVFYIIYPHLDDLGPPFVDHAGRYSSACPICRLPKPSVSCSNQDSTT